MRKYIYWFILCTLLIATIASCKLNRKPSPTSADPEILAAAEAVKIIIGQEGMYRVHFSDLGWAEETAENISLTQKGQAVPYEIQNTDRGPALVFFGEASGSPYTPENVYLLSQNPHNQLLFTTMPVTAGAPPATAAIIKTVHVEENLLYVPMVEDGSPWQWLKIVAPQAQTIDVDLTHLTEGPGQLRAAFWGATSAPVNPDHHVRVRINGHTVGEAAWDEQTWQNLEVEIPAGVLLEGKNRVEIQATGEVETRIDIINLDWLEIDYPKQGDQLEDQEVFRTSNGSVQLAGFEVPLALFEISNPAEISRLEFPSATAESAVFQGNPEYRYLFVSENGYLYPDQIQPLTTDPDLHSIVGADYLAIGHPDLLAPLEPLLQARRGQGLTTLSIPSAAIYDQFNHGLAEPEAIRAFLAFAVENWATPPKYVLLTGDTSYDYYGYQTPLEANFIPTFLVPTVFGGESGSDVRMVQFGSDLAPELAIGRVPARSVAQVETFVDKTLRYEQESSGQSWIRSILAIADGQEVTFKADANHFIEQFTEPYQTALIAPEAGAQGTNQQIATEVENGTLVTAYFGHGSVNMWGKDSLFTTEDSAALKNENLPVVLNFTCLTGLFTHPTEESLAESLLFNPQGGAVAVLAPTSPTLPTDQTFLSDALAKAFSQEPLPRLGDITLSAWQQVPTQTPSSTDVMQTFLLFGDPALQLPSP